MSLKNLENHFDFGKNWREYSQKINEDRLRIAELSLTKFFHKEGIKGKTFIDIGCGSGLFSIAALRQGCKNLLAIDIDPICVSITKNNIKKYWNEPNWHCKVKSVFDLDKNEIGEFDLVYSWGVLHHTGSMLEAIESASQLIDKEGKMLLGLYQKTILCPFWVLEKKIYHRSSSSTQKMIRELFYKLFSFLSLFQYRHINKIIHKHKQKRGMDYFCDLHDWLGGYPYESISPKSFNDFISTIGLKIQKQSICNEGFGLTGSGVNEYLVYKTSHLSE